MGFKNALSKKQKLSHQMQKINTFPMRILVLTFLMSFIIRFYFYMENNLLECTLFCIYLYFSQKKNYCWMYKMLFAAIGLLFFGFISWLVQLKHFWPFLGVREIPQELQNLVTPCCISSTVFDTLSQILRTGVFSSPACEGSFPRMRAVAARGSVYIAGNYVECRT